MKLRLGLEHLEQPTEWIASGVEYKSYLETWLRQHRTRFPHPPILSKRTVRNIFNFPSHIRPSQRHSNGEHTTYRKPIGERKAFAHRLTWVEIERDRHLGSENRDCRHRAQRVPALWTPGERHKSAKPTSKNTRPVWPRGCKNSCPRRLAGGRIDADQDGTRPRGSGVKSSERGSPHPHRAGRGQAGFFHIPRCDLAEVEASMRVAGYKMEAERSRLRRPNDTQRR
ncbi:hypothetical protein BDZ89DRAFT_700997 [Hymenopellis radicata]|nr:hypothetical protein BDZ89DRAFT_700997 [Hymenopellis radicata]